MAVIPAKKRGRPRKSVVAEVPYDSLASPVSENSGSKRPRRNASKKAVANLAQLVNAGRDDVINTTQVNNVDDTDDDDFILNDEGDGEESDNVEIEFENELESTKNEVADLNSSGSGASVRPSGRRNTVQKLRLKKNSTKNMKSSSPGSSLGQKGRPIRLLKRSFECKRQD
ncbi:BEM_collapsed_G0012530.mRNA.1.CDS.1 [Saccharomyces cerevisiae]|nr:BEM_collapsed_G0012530.mRNA.1.CDS.1 [Saccharomyces cerevisiae]